MNTRKVMVCMGTRPEAIKLAPVIKALDEHPQFEVCTVVTGQHRAILDQMLAHFGITPDVDLNLMTQRQALADTAALTMQGVARAIEDHKPDAIVVQGDTNTAFASAMAGFYADVPVAHVEAGLRTHNKRSPFPEEINRRLVAPLAYWHFAPTTLTATNLIDERIAPEYVDVTGNTVIDALLETAAMPLSREDAEFLRVPAGKRRVLVTLHRRESQGDTQRQLCRALAKLADRGDVEVLVPVHPNPAVREVVYAELGDHPNVRLVDPLDYHVFVHAQQSADLILTDSGGVQEEAPALGVPVLVMRDTTERPEGVEAGCSILVGTDPWVMLNHATRLLDDTVEWHEMSMAENPYGDGRSARRIVARLERDLVSRLDRIVPGVTPAPKPVAQPIAA